MGLSRGLDRKKIVLNDWSGWSKEKIVLLIVHGGIVSISESSFGAGFLRSGHRDVVKG